MMPLCDWMSARDCSGPVMFADCCVDPAETLHYIQVLLMLCRLTRLLLANGTRCTSLSSDISYQDRGYVDCLS